MTKWGHILNFFFFWWRVQLLNYWKWGFKRKHESLCHMTLLSIKTEGKWRLGIDLSYHIRSCPLEFDSWLVSKSGSNRNRLKFVFFIGIRCKFTKMDPGRICNDFCQAFAGDDVPKMNVVRMTWECGPL